MPLRQSLAACALAAALSLSLLFPTVLVAQPAATPAVFVSDLVGRALVVEREGDPSPPARHARFRALIDGSFDLPAIAQTVMGRHWGAATAEERTQFTAVFADYMVATYAPKLADYGSVEFQVVGQHAEDAGAMLVSTWAAQGEGAKQIVIDWRAQPQPDGWRITDVVISGISLMQTKRAEISALIAKSDGRIAAMIAELKSKSATP